MTQCSLLPTGRLCCQDVHAVGPGSGMQGRGGTGSHACRPWAAWAAEAASLAQQRSPVRRAGKHQSPRAPQAACVATCVLAQTTWLAGRGGAGSAASQSTKSSSQAACVAACARTHTTFRHAGKNGGTSVEACCPWAAWAAEQLICPLTTICTSAKISPPTKAPEAPTHTSLWHAGERRCRL